MLIVRRIATVAVMVYLLLTVLFIVTGGARDAMMALTGNHDPAAFWYVMTLIGAALLLLLLLTENAYNVAMRRDITRHELKVNELKAKLYDHQMDQRADVRPGTTVPRPEPAPGAIPRGSMSTAVPPPSAADLPSSAEPPTTQAPERPLM